MIIFMWKALSRYHKRNVCGVIQNKKPLLVVSNSFCKTVNFPPRERRIIKKALTYENQGIDQEIFSKIRLLKMAKAKNNMRMIYAMKKQLEDLNKQKIVCWYKKKRFPTGHFSIVAAALPKKFKYTLRDKRKDPKNFNIFRWYNKPYEMRYYQQEMTDIGIEKTRGVFVGAVGVGKTLVAVNLIKELGVTTLFVTPSSALLEQAYRTFIDAFGKSLVGKISSQVIKTKKKLPPIRVVTIQTLASLKKRDMLSDLLHDIDMFMVDEIHHAGAKSYTSLLRDLDHVYYRFGFTGTFLRNDHKTLDMYGFLSDKLYEYLPKQATEEGYLTPVKFVVRRLPGKMSMDYQREYKLNYCGTGGYLSGIIDRVEALPENEQILILVDRKEKAGKVIQEYLKKNGFDSIFICGDNKKEYITDAISQFNDKKIRILIGSTVIGEGVDVHSAQHLILATGGKSIVKIVQAIGRCVRLHPGKSQSYVYDFLFEGTKYLERHLKQRIDIYQTQFSGDVSWEN